MRVLITGIDGFAGGHLVDFLLAHGGVEIHGTCLHADRVAAHAWPSAVQVHALDVCDQAAVRTLLLAVQPDRVFHCAAKSFIPDSYRNPGETYRVNVLGTMAILEAARALAEARGVSPVVVAAGAGQVYAMNGADGRALSEGDRLHPTNPYTASKACADLLVRDYRRSTGVSAVVARSFNHVGPRQPARNVCSDFARRVALIALGKAPRTFPVGNLEIIRDFTDVRDVVRAYWMMAEAMNDRDDVFNVCSGIGVSMGEILEMLQDIAATRVEVLHEPERLRQNDLPRFIGSAARLREVTGWTPTITLRASLQDLYGEWHRNLEHMP